MTTEYGGCAAPGQVNRVKRLVPLLIASSFGAPQAFLKWLRQLGKTRGTIEMTFSANLICWRPKRKNGWVCYASKARKRWN